MTKTYPMTIKLGPATQSLWLRSERERGDDEAEFASVCELLERSPLYASTQDELELLYWAACTSDLQDENPVQWDQIHDALHRVLLEVGVEPEGVACPI